VKHTWQHQYVEANGLRVHCVAQGAGPLLLLLHGFPEFWYSARFKFVGVAGARRHGAQCAGRVRGGYFDAWSNRLTISAVRSRFLS